MKRKRFTKLLMGKGYQRNTAAAMTALIRFEPSPTYANLVARFDDIICVEETKRRIRFRHRSGEIEEHSLLLNREDE